MRRHVGPAFAMVAVVAASCGGDSGVQPGSSASTSASTVLAAPSSSAAVPATTTAGAALVAGPGEMCPPGTSPAVFAYDLDTGADRWATCSDGETQRFLRDATDDVAYLVEQGVGEQGSPGGPPALVALDARDGAERWRVPLASTWFGIPPGPFLGAGVIVAPVGDAEPAIAGIDATSGTVVWRIAADEWAHPVAVTDRVVVVRDDTIVDPGPQPLDTDASGQLVMPTMTYQLDGYDRATGAPMWSTAVERSPDDDGMISAAVSGDTVVLAPGPQSLDASTGQLGWRAGAETPALPIGAIAGGVVLIGSLDEPTTALDLATGAELWTQPGSGPYAGDFATDDVAVYVTDRTDLIAYDLATGAERWRRPNVPDDYTWPWHVAGDALFTMWWNLEARSTADGSVRWQTNYPNGDEPTGPTPRMISVATNATSALVTFYSGTLGGD